ncbi:MAG: hypothetical protein HY912_04345 [Desulfomonile tiedjei]|uniref:Uncharacterized protein n=1 Tax=Desulfomonile tiedjei TaxID=2358 RepID=A0A9D6V0Y4_9BACT|nr:hypothetical protein [Desulfomonile tiedjei]
MRSLRRNSIVGAFAVALVFFLGSFGMIAAQGCYGPSGATCSWGPGGLALYAGYFTHSKGADFSFSAQNQPAGSVSGLRQQFGLQGIELEMILSFKLAPPLGLALGCGYDFPFTVSSEEVVPIAGAASLSRGWRAEPRSGNVHAAVTMDLYPSLVGLLGIKYEAFQTNFRSANNGLTVPGGGLDTADLSFNMYNPYIGVVYSTASRGNGPNIQLGLIGFPTLLGNVDYRETVFGGITVGGIAAEGFQGSNSIGEGYYLNAFGDVSLSALNLVQLGAYAKYEVTNAACSINVGNRNSSLPDVAYKFDFQKRLWSFGGRLSIPF